MVRFRVSVRVNYFRLFLDITARTALLHVLTVR